MGFIMGILTVADLSFGFPMFSFLHALLDSCLQFQFSHLGSFVSLSITESLYALDGTDAGGLRINSSITIGRDGAGRDHSHSNLSTVVVHKGGGACAVRVTSVVGVVDDDPKVKLEFGLGK
ncbi:hypothetical protein NE237_024533 [Protea cynaroides]|uniref:Uncharacterized protein n=1 Tax=Protea cynaroides TaxID=273540 RepID=A0A9Q0JZP9_9MAGN|nr:hypothetical protein NE237_024533 [Protea cynaroides]